MPSNGFLSSDITGKKMNAESSVSKQTSLMAMSIWETH